MDGSDLRSEMSWDKVVQIISLIFRNLGNIPLGIFMVLIVFGCKLVISTRRRTCESFDEFTHYHVIIWYIISHIIREFSEGKHFGFLHINNKNSDKY